LSGLLWRERGLKKFALMWRRTSPKRPSGWPHALSR